MGEDNRKDFMKRISALGLAGLAAASLASCKPNERQKQPETSQETTLDVGDKQKPIISIEERLYNKIKGMNREEVLKFIKTMYVNIDKSNNPESTLKPEELAIYSKNTQRNCFYIEERDAIVLNGQNPYETESKLKACGEKYEQKYIEGKASLIIVAKDGKTIDGVGSVRGTIIDEAAITTPELLKNISADGVTAAQKIPLEIWEDIITLVEYKGYDTEFYRNKAKGLASDISNNIMEYGLDEFLPDNIKNAINIDRNGEER